jgi:branched-chain amino acid transport system permease protein
MVGGIGSILGPVVGAVFLTLLPEILPGKASYHSILYALIILMTLFFLPGGLISLPKTLFKSTYKTPKSKIVESDENT